MDPTQVLVKNDSNEAVHISRNMRLGEAVETQFDGCFHITTGQENMAELATRRPAQEHKNCWVKTMFKRAVTAGEVALLTTTGQTSSTSSGGATGLTQSSTLRVAGEPVINKELSDHKPLLPTTPNIEILTSAKDTLLPSGVTTYGDVPELAEVVNEFPSI